MPTLTVSPVAFFFFEALLTGLIWAVWAVLNFWIWQKTKATSNLLMLIGSAALAVFFVVGSFSLSGMSWWLQIIALGLVSFGFFLSVKPLVEAQLAALKAKIHSATAGKKDGGPPPSA